jgi:16S rRNA (cytidine1402-2'-O)-methyltransferase
MSAGTLYLIPATLGGLKAADSKDNDLTGEAVKGSNPKSEATSNLLDASLPAAVRGRAASLQCFAVENAKTARAFLKAIGTSRPIAELDINEIGHAPDEKNLKPLVDKLLRGVDIGVVAEAGCPGVADPGAQLVRLAHAQGIRVVPLTGPSSILLALMASGLDGQRFAFAGYAPVKSPLREAFVKNLEARSARERETQMLIETPYRNLALMQALTSSLKPDTRLCVAADLTLASETIITKRVSAWRAAPPAPAALDKKPAVFLFLAA